MPIDIDGFVVLSAVARESKLFEPIKSEIGKAGRGLVVRLLKAKTMDINGLGQLARALSPVNFSSILDSMSESEIRSLIGKVDRNNVDVKSAGAVQQRRHLSALASGEIEPVARKYTDPKQDGAAAETVERALNTKSMRAIRKAKITTS